MTHHEALQIVHLLRQILDCMGLLIGLVLGSFIIWQWQR